MKPENYEAALKRAISLNRIKPLRQSVAKACTEFGLHSRNIEPMMEEVKNA